MSVLISFLVSALLLQRAPAPVAAPPKPGTPAPVAAAEAPQTKYLVGIQDQLKITVLDEADLSTTYRVDSDGMITLNYIGKVQAAGVTLTELQERIRKKLGEGYLRNPQVRVEVESYKSQSVMVSGEVRSPGKITRTGAMTGVKCSGTAA